MQSLSMSLGVMSLDVFHWKNVHIERSRRTPTLERPARSVTKIEPISRMKSRLSASNMSLSTLSDLILVLLPCCECGAPNCTATSLRHM